MNAQLILALAEHWRKLTDLNDPSLDARRTKILSDIMCELRETPSPPCLECLARSQEDEAYFWETHHDSWQALAPEHINWGRS